MKYYLRLSALAEEDGCALLGGPLNRLQDGLEAGGLDGVVDDDLPFPPPDGCGRERQKKTRLRPSNVGRRRSSNTD